MDPFNLEQHYQFYLQRGGVREIDMQPIQRQETKRAFMAGCGQMLIVLKEDISLLEEREGVERLQNMMDQVQEFWQKELDKAN